jgi:hypothetical protein
MNLIVGAIWNRASLTECQIMGHKGPAWRPRCIWPRRAWTQILLYYAGQFLDALKTVIISGRAYWNKDGDTYLADKLPPFLEPSSASSTSPSTSRGGETTDSFADVSFGKEAQRAVSATVRTCDMKLFLVVYVSGFIAKRLLNGSSCDTCKKCLISEVPSPHDIFTGFMERSSRILLVLLWLLKKVMSKMAQS